VPFSLARTFAGGRCPRCREARVPFPGTRSLGVQSVVIWARLLLRRNYVSGIGEYPDLRRYRIRRLIRKLARIPGAGLKPGRRTAAGLSDDSTPKGH
jgi:hypothetical protein